MQSPISSRTSQCLKHFTRLQAKQKTFRQSEAGETNEVDDSTARFRIWAANLGAYHPAEDHKSADHRLQSAPAIVKHLSEVLDDLTSTLKDAADIADGTRADQGLTSTVDQKELEGVLGEGDGKLSEFAELVSSLPDLITSLMKISILIRNNTTRDRYARAANYKPLSSITDCMYVRDKFPKLENKPWLRERLGNAITQRRQYLSYSNDHHHKIGFSDDSATAPSLLQSAPTPQQQLVDAMTPFDMISRPSLAPTTASTLQMTNLPLHMPDSNDDDSESGRSRATSFASSKASDLGDRFNTIPELNSISKPGQPFECCYCWAIIRRPRNQRSWLNHVLSDLRAYVCTFAGCHQGLFENRDTWFKHELSAHRRIWTCMTCPDVSYDSENELQGHLRRKHPSHFDELSKGSPILTAGSRPASEISASLCVFCDEYDTKLRAEASDKGISVPSNVPLKVPVSQFRSHLGHHLAELALFALPRSYDSDDPSELEGLDDAQAIRDADDDSDGRSDINRLESAQDTRDSNDGHIPTIESTGDGDQAQPDTSSLRAALAFPEMYIRQDTIAKAYYNTCEWLLETQEYKRWRDPMLRPEHHGILWITGGPGVGKSTMMKYLVEQSRKQLQQLHDEGKAISFFFNLRGTHLERSAEGLYRALLHQVVEDVPQLQGMVSPESIASCRDNGWPLELLENLLSEAVLHCGHKGSLTCYIDALDECDNKEVHDIMSFFDRLEMKSVSTGAKVSICFASPQYPQLTIAHYKEIQLDGSGEHSDDISQYVQHKLRIYDERLQEDLTAKIAQRSSGVFLWAVLVVGRLNEMCDRGSSVSELMARFEAFPASLGQLLRD